MGLSEEHHYSRQSFGPLDRTKLGLINFVLTLAITIIYLIALVLYPIIYGGYTESGGILNYHENYYWSYYLMIPLIILTIIAVVLNAGAVRGSSYSPIK